MRMLYSLEQYKYKCLDSVHAFTLWIQKYFTSVGKCITKWGDAHTLDLGTVPTFRFPVILSVFQINPCLHQRCCPFPVLLQLLAQHIPILLVMTQKSEKRTLEKIKRTNKPFETYFETVETIQGVRNPLSATRACRCWASWSWPTMGSKGVTPRDPIMPWDCKAPSLQHSSLKEASNHQWPLQPWMSDVGHLWASLSVCSGCGPCYGDGKEVKGRACLGWSFPSLKQMLETFRKPSGKSCP